MQVKGGRSGSVAGMRTRGGGSVFTTGSGESTFYRALGSGQVASIERGLFLVIYSMMSYNSVKDYLLALAFLVEPLQLLAISFTSPAFYWPTNSIVYVLQRASLLVSTVFQSKTYDGRVIEFWVATSMILLVLVTLAYVAFRLSYTNSSPSRALDFLRIVVCSLISFLYMPLVELLTIFGIPNVLDDGTMVLAAFPGQGEIDYGIFVGAWLLIVVFGLVSFTTATIAVDVEGAFGMTHGRSELVALVCKLALLLLQQLQPVAGNLISIGKPIVASLLLYQLLYFFPYNSLASNQFRAAAFTVFLWTTVVEVMRVGGVSLDIAGDVLLLGLGPAAYLGTYLAFKRWHLVISRMPSSSKVLQIITSGDGRAEDALVKRLGLDQGETDVDILVRHVMRRTDSGIVGLQRSDHHDVAAFSILTLLGVTFHGDDSLDSGDADDDDEFGGGAGQEEGRDQTETIRAMAKRSKRRWVSFEKRVMVMQWLYTKASKDLGESGRFWLSILNTHHFFGQALPIRMSAAAAIKISSMDLRYCLFRYLFERRRQQLAEGVGTVRYLDLSKSLRSAQYFHRKTLAEMRNFLQMMIATNSPSSNKVQEAVGRIGAAEEQASRTFEALLQKHSYSTQVLRSYSLFLLQVHGMEEESQNYLELADAVEEEAAASRAAALSTQVGTRGGKDKGATGASVPGANGAYKRSVGPSKPGMQGYSSAADGSGRSGEAASVDSAAAASAGSQEGSEAGGDNLGDSNPPMRQTGGTEAGQAGTAKAGIGERIHARALGMPMRDAPGQSAQRQPGSAVEKPPRIRKPGSDLSPASGSRRPKVQRQPSEREELAMGLGYYSARRENRDGIGEASSGGAALAESTALPGEVQEPIPNYDEESSFRNRNVSAGEASAILHELESPAPGERTPLPAPPMLVHGGTHPHGGSESKAEKAELDARESAYESGVHVVPRLPVESADDGDVERKQGDTPPSSAALKPPGPSVLNEQPRASRVSFGGIKLSARSVSTSGFDADSSIGSDRSGEDHGQMGPGGKGKSKRHLGRGGSRRSSFTSDRGRRERKKKNKKKRTYHEVAEATKGATRSKQCKKSKGCDSEAERPREFPGIRRMRCVLCALYAVVLATLCIPFTISVTELSKLQRNLQKVASSGRREQVFWLLSSYLAHVERLEDCGNSPGIEGIPPAFLLDPAEAIGELSFIQHRLVFCDEPHENLNTYREFSNQFPTGCPSGDLATSLTRDESIRVDDLTASINETTGEFSLVAFGRDLLTDDYTQKIIYDIRRATANVTYSYPGTGWGTVISQETHWLVGAEFVAPPTQVAALLQHFNKSCIVPAMTYPEYSEAVNGWAGVVYNVHRVGHALSRSTDVYEAAVRSSDTTFLVVLSMTSVLLVGVFSSLPFFLYWGLRAAHMEHAAGYYLLDAVPLSAFEAVLDRLDGAQADGITEAGEMHRQDSFEDVRELAGKHEDSMSQIYNADTSKLKHIFGSQPARPGSIMHAAIERLKERMEFIIEDVAGFGTAHDSMAEPDGIMHGALRHDGPPGRQSTMSGAIGTVATGSAGAGAAAVGTSLPSQGGPEGDFGEQKRAAGNPSPSAGAAAGRLPSSGTSDLWDGDGNAASSSGRVNRTGSSGAAAVEGNKRADMDPLLLLVDEIRYLHEEDWWFRFDLWRVLGASGIMWVATTVIAILLPLMYLRASEIISQFDVMGRWLVTITRSSFEYLTFTAKAQRVVSYSNFPDVLGVPDLGLETWYNYNLTWDQGILDIMADEGERLHRCVVFGCAEEDVPGISTSSRLEEYFFGPNGIDEGFKIYVQHLRLRDVVSPLYTAAPYFGIRDLPRLYASLFEDWANYYVTTLIVGMAGVFVVVTIAFLRYYYVFVHSFTKQTKRYRFVLSLLPDRLVTRIPMFTSFMVNTDWVEPSYSIETNMNMLLGDDDDKV